MCAVCGSFPCLNRCPNATEPKPIHKCCKCGNGIMDGDRYYDSLEGCVCMDCIEDMTVSEFMELAGETLSIAEREE